MAKRRANNEGSIFKDSRGYWVAEIAAPDGKKIRKTSKKQSVVREWLQQTAAQIRAGQFVSPSQITVADVCERYLRDVAPIKLRPNTLTSYRIFINKHILPAFGNTPLQKLRAADIQELYRAKLEEGLSKRSVELIHTIFGNILNLAVRWGLLAVNPCRQVDVPRPEKREKKLLTIAQAQKLLSYSRTQSYSHFPLYAIAIGCGLREGEIMGLRRRDIDLEHGAIHVRQTIARSEHGSYISAPKSEASVRTVGMPTWTIEAVRPCVEAVVDDNELVFKGRNGEPLTASKIYHHLQFTLDELGLPRVTFHSLRHLNISLLAAENLPPKEIQQHAGHSSIQVTMDIYGHVLQENERRAARKLDNKFQV